MASCALAVTALTLTAEVLAVGTWSTTVAITSSSNPSQAGQSIHLAAIVSESGNPAVPTGSVTFVDSSLDPSSADGTVLCADIPLVGSSSVKTATCDTPTTLNPGIHPISAQYSGDSNYAVQASNSITQTITGMLLSPSTATSEYSQFATFIATVTGSNPTGTVVVSDVDSLSMLCSGSLGGTGNTRTFACVLNNPSPQLPPGTYNLGAAYHGDANNPSYVSNNVSYRVTQALSHTSLVSPVSGTVQVGQSVHFVARLTVDSGVTIAPTGSVTFIDGGTSGSVERILCQATAVPDSPGALTATASCDAAESGLGSRIVGSSFQPDSPYMAGSGSNENVRLNVLAAPNLALTSAPNPAVWSQDLILTATLSGAYAPSGSVQFLKNGVPMSAGTCAAVHLSPTSGSNYTATCDATGYAGVGATSFTAVFSGDANNGSATSPALTQTVTKASVNMQVSAAPAGIVLGSSTTVSVSWHTAAPSSDGSNITGTISVGDGSASCAPIAVPSPLPYDLTVTCTFTPTSAGARTLTASYSGDTHYNPATATGTLNVSAGDNGACGAANGALTTTAPSANLCSAGTPSTVSATANQFTWTCSGTGSGTAANCSAPRAYTVTASAGANGNISPSGSSAIAYGSTASFSVTPASGYSASVSGCGGALAGNLYTTAPISADCSVTATFTLTSTANVNLDQFGLSGTWENTATSGQGFVLSMFPDYLSPGHGIAAAGWFTFDVAPSGGPEKQRWYSLQGLVDNVHRVAALDIYYNDGGNFDAPPKIPSTPIGSATLQFSDCLHGSLAYTFTDGSGRSGTIPLSRADVNITCTPAGDGGTPASAYLLSGAWYKQETSGQGFYFAVNPSQQLLFIAWYTYMPNGLADGSAAQRWYILQMGPNAGYAPSTSPTSGIPIFASTGGVFDNPAPHTLTQVGTATLTFINCGQATIEYNFDGGTSAGLSGRIDLVKLGAIPTQCGLSP